MKYTIKYACGHEANMQIYGTNAHGERDRKIANEECKLCPECYQKKMAEKNAAATAEAKAQNLPELTGSEKQVGWANSIRLETLAKLREMAETDLEYSIIDCIIEMATSASEWIENRFTPTDIVSVHLAEISEKLGKNIVV